MELDVIERNALELLRSRLQNGNITPLSAKRDPAAQDQITVNGTFQEAQGRQRTFEVKFQIKQDQPQIVEWPVS